MVLNDVVARQEVLNRIVFVNGDRELSNDLKVKLIKFRLGYRKIQECFNLELKTATMAMIPRELQDLNAKQDKTPENIARIEELSNKVNSNYRELVISKSKEDLAVPEVCISETEFSEIVNVHTGLSIDLNGVQLSDIDFLESVYELFVK